MNIFSYIGLVNVLNMSYEALDSFDESQFADMIHLYEIDIEDNFDIDFEDVQEVDISVVPHKYENEISCVGVDRKEVKKDACMQRKTLLEEDFNDIDCLPCNNNQDLDSIDENSLNNLFREIPLLDLEEYNDEEFDDIEVQNERKHFFIINCKRCSTDFRDRQEFLSHSGPCFKKDIIEYTCKTCSQSFTRYALFRIHCMRHVPDKHMCLFCEGEFVSQSVLASHISSTHSSIYPHVCKECGLLCPSRPALELHKKKNHWNNKGYPCNICNRVLFLRRNLIRHVRIHNSGKLYMCDACGKRFIYKLSLMDHLANIHAENRPYPCDICHKWFPEESFLKRHKRLHTDLRPFVCNICNKSFKTNAALNTHSLTHDFNKRFTCSKCNKGFTKLSKLKEHENIHTGKRPYQCQYCWRSFTNSPNMLKHIKRRPKPLEETKNGLYFSKNGNALSLATKKKVRREITRFKPLKTWRRVKWFGSKDKKKND